MEILTRLSPAETYLLLEQGNAQFKELLKFTFVDLIRKDILEPIQLTKRVNSREKPRTYSYVQVGKRFKGYRPLKHELPFLSPFLKNSSIQIFLRSLMTIGIENSGGANRYVKSILTSPHFDLLMSKTFLSRLFNSVNPTSLGRNVHYEITEHLNYLERVIPDMLIKDQEEALKYLLAIQGNCYLLKNLDFVQLKEIDSELLKKMKKKHQDTNHGCSACGSWWDYDDYSGHFDDSFDSSSHSDESGCGGDNGCSGCSGCGGCGGCD